VDHSWEDFDYSYYLGPNYRQEYKAPTGRGTIPSYFPNHTSIVDFMSVVAVMDGKMNYAAFKGVLNIPFFNLFTRSMGCVFIPRGASKEILEQAAEEVKKR
jgi:1-acyl-sn-glycerol-3-phosphate acyltransferase